MRVIKIKFSGYKRLLDTSCNVDAKLVALLGPNEAGKSSVLSGLVWLGDGTAPLPSHILTRDYDFEPKQAIATMDCILDDDDIAAISNIATASRPTRCSITRHADGSASVGLTPYPKWQPEPFRRAAETLRELVEFISTHLDDETDEFRTRATELITSLDNYEDLDSAADSPRIQAVEAEVADLSSIEAEAVIPEYEPGLVLAEIGEKISPVCKSLAAARAVLDAGHPEPRIRDIVFSRRPQFLLFEQADRTLDSIYDLHNDAIRLTPPKALENLLKVGQTTTEELYLAMTSGDTTRRNSLVRRVNQRLESALRHRWRQSDVSVQVQTNGRRLEILVHEHEVDGAVTAFEERSDGMRTFIALLCFLEVQASERPIVLLIDEAETHLHLDAQADLVEVLSEQVATDQVIYTTHSPGCLPRDLGTGVRFISPNAKDSSISDLRNDFWSSGVPGFRPLLYAMGAGASAFSACRRALICEGASDMILLPTLLRKATDATNLPYQVAPGLSSAIGELAEMNAVAADVAYLADGDGGGRNLQKQLIDAGVPQDRIFQLAPGKAIEDYIPPALFDELIAALIVEAGHEPPDMSGFDRPDGIPVAKACATWLKSQGVRPPGKVAFAARAVRSLESATLSESDHSFLKDLAAKIGAALGAS